MKPVEIESLALKDSLAYGISYIDLLQNREWEVASRPWTVELYQVVNPYLIERDPLGRAKRMVVMKSTQCGLSTMAIVRMFHLAEFWLVRIFYMLPRQQDVIDFVSTRIDPMLHASPRLKNLLSVPDSTHIKRIGNSYLFFMEASVEPRMMPVDALFKDEIDLCDQTNLATAINRMDASNWKLDFAFSTPTVTNYGIHASYLNSDMREWLVRCRHCGHDQTLEWGSNLRIVGPHNKPTRVYYGCAACDQEIRMEDVRQGRWIAQKPDRTEDVIGFHISQMMIYPASVLYTAFRDPQTKLVEFYRKRLGMPYEIGEGSLERDDFLVNCFDEPYEPEETHDGVSRYYIGVDQGNELQVVVGKISPENRQRKVVHIELVPFEIGFPRVGKLIQIYKARRCVIDGNPNRHSVADLQKDFPGKVIIANYSEQKKRMIIHKDETKKKTILTVSINRTDMFDHLFKAIKDGEWSLPGSAIEAPREVELLIDHCTALRRDIEFHKTTSGEIPVGVYRAVRAEHLAHGWGYMETAMEIDQGGKFRMSIIGKSQEEEVPATEGDIPSAETIAGIVWLLAEVPRKQLSEYMIQRENPEYTPPFPLSHKLDCALESFSLKDILYVIEKWLKDKQ